MNVLILPYLRLYGGKHSEACIVSEFNRLGYGVSVPNTPRTLEMSQRSGIYNSVTPIEPYEVRGMKHSLVFLTNDLSDCSYRPFLEEALNSKSAWYLIHPDWFLMRNHVWETPKVEPIQPYYQRRMVPEFPLETYKSMGRQDSIPYILSVLSRILQKHPIYFNSNFARNLSEATVNDPRFYQLLELYGIEKPDTARTDLWRTVYLPGINISGAPHKEFNNGKKIVIFPSRFSVDKSADAIHEAIRAILNRRDITVVLTRLPNLASEWESMYTSDIFDDLCARYDGRIITPGRKGYFTTDQYEYWLRQADLALFGGPHETFGRSVQEAGSRHTAVIAPDVSVFPEIWEGAVLVEFDKMINETVETASRLLDDPAELEYRKSAVMDTARRFTPRRFVEEIVNNLENL